MNRFKPRVIPSTRESFPDHVRKAILQFYESTVFLGRCSSYLTCDSIYETTYKFVTEYAQCEKIQLSENDLSRSELDMGRVYSLTINSKKIEFRHMMQFVIKGTRLTRDQITTEDMWIISQGETEETWRQLCVR